MTTRELIHLSVSHDGEHVGEIMVDPVLGYVELETDTADSNVTLVENSADHDYLAAFLATWSDALKHASMLVLDAKLAALKERIFVAATATMRDDDPRPE